MAKPDVLLSFINTYKLTTGKWPSLMDMAQGVGMSKSGVYARVKKLVISGKLTYDVAARSYRVLAQSKGD